MNRRILVTTAFALAAIACYAVTMEAVTIAWKPKAGNTLKYKFKGSASVQGQDLQISADMDEVIKDVKTDGNIVVEDKQTNFVVMFGGNDVSGSNPVKSTTDTMVMKPNGEVLSRKSDAPAESSTPRLDALSQFIYPDHAVNNGDTWKFSGKADKAKGTYDYETTYTYQGTETVNGIASNKVGVSYKEIGADAPVTATGTLWVAVDDGELAKATEKVKGAPFPGGMSADMDISIDRA